MYKLQGSANSARPYFIRSVPQHPTQGPAHGNCSVNVCWMNEENQKNENIALVLSNGAESKRSIVYWNLAHTEQIGAVSLRPSVGKAYTHLLSLINCELIHGPTTNMCFAPPATYLCKFNSTLVGILYDETKH